MKILERLGEVIGHVIDAWGAEETYEQLTRRHHLEINQLQSRNDLLEEQLDHLRFNGTSLWADEVDALLAAKSVMDSDDYAAYTKKHRQAIQALLARCDHLPYSAKELGTMVDDVINGVTKTVPWEPLSNAAILKEWDGNSSDCEPYESKFKDGSGDFAPVPMIGSDDDIPF